MLFSMVLLVVLALAGAAQTAPPPPPPPVPREPVTFSCLLPSMCNDHPPASEWDGPSCDDVELDDALFESVDRGDHSALEVLRQRYLAERTFVERYRIAPMLLGHVAGDAAIWNDIAPHAENFVDFAGHPEKFAAYCAEHGLRRRSVRAQGVRGARRRLGRPARAAAAAPRARL